MISTSTSNDISIEELTLLVFVGCSYHTFIGDFQANNVTRGLLPFPCTGKEPVQDVHNATLSGTIPVTTLTRAYTFKDVIKFVKRGDFAAVRFDDSNDKEFEVSTAAFAIENLLTDLQNIQNTGVDGVHPASASGPEGLRTKLVAYPSINF